MATIKSYTDLEQSKDLAKILPMESADMFLAMNGTLPVMSKYIDDGLVTADNTAIPCWSLAALLNILPNYQLQTQDDGIGILCSCDGKFNIVTADNPVDACVEMIEKLHDKML